MTRYYGIGLMLLVAIAPSAANAQDMLFGELGDPFTLTGEDDPVTIGGWSQWGYTNKSDGVFNTYEDHFQAQQQWLYAERVADGSEGFDWGFRMDVVYGTDAQNTQAFGNEPGTWDFQNGWDHGEYGWALPQLYGEVAMGDVSIKAGHFFTLLGYHVVPATGNFFYSHPFTMNFSEAFTHTGVLASYSASDDVTLYGGWTLGWDTAFDQYDGGNSFLGGASVQIFDELNATYILTAGDLGWVGEGYTHSLVFNYAITDSLSYILQSDYLQTNEDALGSGGNTYHTIGVNNNLIWWMSDRIGLGGRAEWWKANGVSYYEITGGINIKPCANFVIRPEVRYQWAPAGNDFSGVKNGSNPAGLPLDEGAIFGVDAILTF